MEDPVGRKDNSTKGLLRPEALMPIVTYCVSVELEKWNITQFPPDRFGSLLAYIQKLEQQQLPEKYKQLGEDVGQLREFFKIKTENVSKLEADLLARSEKVASMEQNLIARTEAVKNMQEDLASRMTVVEKKAESHSGEAESPLKQTEFNVVDQLSVLRKDEEKLRRDVFAAMTKNKEEVQNLISGVLKRLESFCSASRSASGNETQQKHIVSTETAELADIKRQQQLLMDQVAKLEKAREESLLAQQEMKRIVVTQSDLTYEIAQKVSENSSGQSIPQSCSNCSQMLVDLNLLRTNQEIMVAEQNTLKQTVSTLISRCDQEFEKQISRTEKFQKIAREHTEIMEIQEEMLDKQDALKQTQNTLVKDQGELKKIQESSKTRLELLSHELQIIEKSTQALTANFQKNETNLRSLEKNTQTIQSEQKRLEKICNEFQSAQEKMSAEQKFCKENHEKEIKEVRDQLFALIQNNQDVISKVQNTNQSQFDHLKQIASRLQEKVISDHELFTGEVLKAHEWCKKIEADQTQNLLHRNGERMKLTSTVDGLKVELENLLGKVSELQEEQDKISAFQRKFYESHWKRAKMSGDTADESDHRALVYYNSDSQINSSCRSIQYHADSPGGLCEEQSTEDPLCAVPFSDPNDPDFRGVMNMFEDIDEESRDADENPGFTLCVENNDDRRGEEVENLSSTGFYYDSHFPKDVKPVFRGSHIQEQCGKDRRNIGSYHGSENLEAATVNIEDEILLTTDDGSNTEETVARASRWGTRSSQLASKLSVLKKENQKSFSDKSN